MKLALISDIHANLAALQATLADISTRAADRIVCLGDIVGYNANPSECVRLVRDSNAICVAGNHDLAVCGRTSISTFSPVAARSVDRTRPRLAAEDLDFLRALPLQADIGGGVIAVHGALHPETGCEHVRLDNDAQRLLSFKALMAHPSGARICAFGHTHRPGIYEFRDGAAVERIGREIRLRNDAYYLINPGTVGEPRTRDRRATYMLLDLAGRVAALRHVEYKAATSARRHIRLAAGFGANVLDRLRAIARSDRDWRSSAE